MVSSMVHVKMNCIPSIAGYQSKEAVVSQLTVFLIIVTATLPLVPQMNNLNEQALSVVTFGMRTVCGSIASS